jgi:lipopolysaccharide heptosyltransferase II
LIERVLVVQTAFLGDVVLTTPLLRELKRLAPGARLTVVTTPLGGAVLEGHPCVDAIVVHDKKGADRGPYGVVRTVRALRRERFDVAIAAQRSFRTGLLIRGCGAADRIGFAEASGMWAYTTRVPWTASDHAVRRYLALAGPLGGGGEAADPAPSLAVRADARARVDALLAESGIGEGEAIVALAPGSVWGSKRWTPDGFAGVADAAPRLGLRPVLVGSPDEEPLCRDVARRASAPVVVLAGATGPPDLIALLARARALVVGDSGPGHIASAVGTPVVAIFGPTVPAFGYAPWGERNVVVEHPALDCRPCDSHGPRVCPLGHHRCMKEIPAERVVQALAGVLA